jgi:hypothetical protein
MTKHRRWLLSFVALAIVASVLAVIIARPGSTPSSSGTANAAATTAAATHAGYVSSAPTMPTTPTNAHEGPPPELLDELAKEMNSPASLRKSKEQYLAANRYPHGVIRATKEMVDLLQPNKLETVMRPALQAPNTKEGDRVSAIFQAGIARTVGKDPIPLRLAVFRGPNKTPEPAKVLVTKIVRLDDGGAQTSLGSFTLARQADSEELSGTWTPPAELEGYNGLLMFLVQWQANGIEPQGSSATLEYTDVEPARIMRVDRDELVGGSIDVHIALDVKMPGLYLIDARIYAADGTTPIGFTQTTPTLAEGNADVKLTFYGLLFHDAKIAGPYVLKMVTGHVQSFSPTGGRGREMRSWTGTYTTKPYSLAELTDKEWDSPTKQKTLKSFDDQITALEKQK